MFVKNFYKNFAGWITGDPFIDSTTPANKTNDYSANTNDWTFKWGSTSTSSNAYEAGANLHKLWKSYQYGGVYMGDGDTPPTPDDIKLAGNLITTFTYTSVVTSQKIDNGVEITATYTITNTGTENFTIKEVGLFSGSGGVVTMYERTVLDAPVTIPSGGIGKLTYTIRFNYPT